MVIQVLVEITDGDLEQVKCTFEIFVLFSALENTGKYDEENKIHPNMYKTSLEENEKRRMVASGEGNWRGRGGGVLVFTKYLLLCCYFLIKLN